LKSGAVPLARWEGEGGSVADHDADRPRSTRGRPGEIPAVEHEPMKVQILDDGVEVAEALRTHVRRRLGLSLGRFADEIDRVIVHFSISESKRFGERHCKVEVKLRPESLTVQDTANDLLAAADHAVDKAVRLVARTFQDDSGLGTGARAARLRRVAKP
jgi:ribosomal subunit interface protein